MSEWFADRSIWLVILNVGLALLVVIPTLVLVVSLVVGFLARALRREKREVNLVEIPGIGIIPVLQKKSA